MPYGVLSLTICKCTIVLWCYTRTRSRQILAVVRLVSLRRPWLCVCVCVCVCVCPRLSGPSIVSSPKSRHGRNGVEIGGASLGIGIAGFGDTVVSIVIPTPKAATSFWTAKSPSPVLVAGAETAAAATATAVSPGAPPITESLAIGVGIAVPKRALGERTPSPSTAAVDVGASTGVTVSPVLTKRYLFDRSPSEPQVHVAAVVSPTSPLPDVVVTPSIARGFGRRLGQPVDGGLVGVGNLRRKGLVAVQLTPPGSRASSAAPAPRVGAARQLTEHEATILASLGLPQGGSSDGGDGGGAAPASAGGGSGKPMSAGGVTVPPVASPPKLSLAASTNQPLIPVCKPKHRPVGATLSPVTKGAARGGSPSKHGGGVAGGVLPQVTSGASVGGAERSVHATSLLISPVSTVMSAMAAR